MVVGLPFSVGCCMLSFSSCIIFSICLVYVNNTQCEIFCFFLRLLLHSEGRGVPISTILLFPYIQHFWIWRRSEDITSSNNKLCVFFVLYLLLFELYAKHGYYFNKDLKIVSFFFFFFLCIDKCERWWYSIFLASLSLNCLFVGSYHIMMGSCRCWLGGL